MGVYNHWTGMVDWTGGMEQWNGLDLLSKTSLSSVFIIIDNYIIYIHVNYYYNTCHKILCYIPINTNHHDMHAIVKMAY